MRSSLAWALTAFATVHIALAAPSPQSASRTSRCGSSFGLTCRGSSFGECCSQYNYCGSTSDYCDAKKGCQAGWGKCSSASAPSTPAEPKISKDGQCGRDNGGTTCKGSKYGDCCSQYGWCGSTKTYCTTGCNALFGTCSAAQSSPGSTPSSTKPLFSMTVRSSASTSNSATRSSPSASPTSSINKSTNSRCGNEQGASPKGMTCHGTKWGNCCSKWGYCGSTEAYCGNGCQTGFGDCQAVSSSGASTSAPVISSKASSSTTDSESTQSPSGSSSTVSSTNSLTSSESESTSSSALVSSSINSATPSPTPSPDCKMPGYPVRYGPDPDITSQADLAGCEQRCISMSQCQYIIYATAAVGYNCVVYTRTVEQDGPIGFVADYITEERSCFASSSPLSSSSPVAVSSSSSAGAASSNMVVSSTPIASSTPVASSSSSVDGTSSTSATSSSSTLEASSSTSVAVFSSSSSDAASSTPVASSSSTPEAASSTPVAASSTTIQELPSSTSSSATPSPTKTCNATGYPVNRDINGGYFLALSAQNVIICRQFCTTYAQCQYSVYFTTSRTCFLYSRPLSQDGTILSNPLFNTSEWDCPV